MPVSKEISRAGLVLEELSQKLNRWGFDRFDYSEGPTAEASDRQIDGSIFVNEIWEDVVEVEMIHVNPSRRGQGIGSKMLTILTEIADQRQCRLLLEVRPFDMNKRAEIANWYSRNGFAFAPELAEADDVPMMREPGPVITQELEIASP